MRWPLKRLWRFTTPSVADDSTSRRNQKRSRARRIGNGGASGDEPRICSGTLKPHGDWFIRELHASPLGPCATRTLLERKGGPSKGAITQRGLLENPVARFFDEAECVPRIRRVLGFTAHRPGLADKLLSSRNEVHLNDGVYF